MSKNIEEKVIEYIKKNKLLAETSKVYVATSGGADSMSLLAFMNSHKDEFKIEVGVVHVNHGIRGETARRDADFVRGYCEYNNIEYVLFDAEADKVEVPENASEEWARQLRYNYLNSLCKKGVRIATAHTLSDQTETILFRMARGGSGLKGLTGIPVKRDSYIRPFLCINRAEVEQLVEYYGTGHITDETNLGDDYSRNRIRHYVVPELKRINEQAEASFGKACERISKAQKYIEKQAKLRLNEYKVIEGLCYYTDGFIGVDEIIIDEMILQLTSNINAQNEQYFDVIKGFLSKRTTDELSEVVLGKLMVNDSVSIIVTNDYVTIEDTRENEPRNIGVGVNNYSLHGYSLTINTTSMERFKKVTTNKYELCNFIDASKVDIEKCIMRGRKEGDVFKPACKMKGKLVKFMRNIPLAQRESVPVIEYNGEIIWVWGLGFTDGLTPTEDSEKIYEFRWK